MESSRIDVETVADRLQEARRWIERRRRAWEVPGVGVGVVAGGRVVLAEGFGTTQVASGTPVTADTVFAICSCTKAFTTMLMGMLADEGRLEWDRPVREVLPEFELSDRVATERLTPRDLVTHRGGLPRHDLVWFGATATREELVRALRHLEPTADLRVRYQYQNLMYMTAGYLVGRLTDSTWEEQLRARLLDPLGMTSATTSVRCSRGDPQAARPHERHRGAVRTVPYRNLDALGPAGSINASVKDVLPWLLLHLEGGRRHGRRLISLAQLRQMHAPQMVVGEDDQDPAFRFVTYGLGWTVMAYRTHRVATHSGGIDGFRCRTALWLDAGVGTVVFTNSDTALSEVLTWELADRVLGLDPAGWSRRFKARKRQQEEDQRRRTRAQRRRRQRRTRPSHRPAAYAGVYRHPAYGTFTVRRDRTAWTAALNDLSGRLVHYHYDLFELRHRNLPTSLLVTFHTDREGVVSSLSVPLQEGVADILFTRAAGPDAAPGRSS